MQLADDIQCLRLGLRALRLLNEREALSCGELAKALSISRATAFRVLGTLEQLRYATEAEAGRPRRLRLGLGARRLSAGYAAERELTDVARPLMCESTAAHGWPLALGVALQDHCFLCFTTDAATTRLLSRVHAGTRLPLQHSAMGQVCLAGLPVAERLELARRLELPQVDVERCVQQVRTQGFALDDRPQDREIDLAVPIVRRRRVVAALNLRYMRVAARGPAGHVQRLTLLASLADRIAYDLDVAAQRRGGERRQEAR